MKIVGGDDIFFKDDIKLLEKEMKAPLNLPQPLPILTRDELQIIYNGHIYVATEKKTPGLEIKIYSSNFGLAEIESPKEQEDKYFKDNEGLLGKLKKDFIERSISGIDVNDPASMKSLYEQLSGDLIKKVKAQYPLFASKQTTRDYNGKGNFTRLDDNSLFNTYLKSDCLLIQDDRVYSLITIPEYLGMFQKAFEPDFYKKAVKEAAKSTPEEMCNYLTGNSDKVNRKALPAIRNKIWHSKRSMKIELDGTYFIPQYKGKLNAMSTEYYGLIEGKVKLDAIEENKVGI